MSPPGPALALLALAAAGSSGGAEVTIEPGTARIILWSIAAAAAVVWLLALRGYLGASRLGQDQGGEIDPATGRRRPESVRVKVVAGAPADVADGLVRALASPGFGTAPLMVKREGDALLAAVPAAGPSLRAAPGFSRCAVEIRPAGADRTEVLFRTDYSAIRARALRTARLLLAAGLVWLVALTLGLHFLAAGADQPALRFQVIQELHALHLLWPPWLIYVIYRRNRRATEAYLDAAAANASALAEAFAAGRSRGEATG